LRVLIAGAVLDSSWPGGEPRIARELVHGLRRSGVEVITHGKVRPWRRPLSRAVLPYDITPQVHRSYSKLIRHDKPDIVLGFYDYDCSLYLSSLKLRTPCVACAHIFWPACPMETFYVDHQGVCEGRSFSRCVNHMRCSRYRMAKHLAGFPSALLEYVTFLSRRRILDHLDALVVPSQAVERKLRSAGFHNIEVIYNGIDLHEIEYKEWSGGQKIVLNPTGRTDEMKGLSHFIAVARKVKRRLGAHVKFLATGYGGDNWVDGAEFPSRSDVLNLLEQSYLSVIPPLWEEPCPVRVIESMAAGKPVVAYDSGGIREIVVDGVTGFCIPQGDIDAMASAVESLVEDEELARKMGMEGRRRVEQCFSRTLMVRKHIDLLNRILSTTRC
jgi:glycosyltransferase involved in cell wall biosynthesis